MYGMRSRLISATSEIRRERKAPSLRALRAQAKRARDKQLSSIGPLPRHGIPEVRHLHMEGHDNLCYSFFTMKKAGNICFPMERASFLQKCEYGQLIEELSAPLLLKIW